MAQELTSSDVPNAVKKILSHKGAKLRAHEIHIRRAEKGAYIAKHLLRDKSGNLPTDGQRSESEYALPDANSLAAHIQEHMGQEQEPDTDDQD